MTKLESYIKAYNAEIAEHPEHPYIAPRSLWIACKWTMDVGFVPWRADAESILMNLYCTDPELSQKSQAAF